MDRDAHDRDDRGETYTYYHTEPGSGFGGAYPASGEPAAPAVPDTRPDPYPVPVSGEPVGQRGGWRARAARARKSMPLWQELPLLLVIAFCLAVLVRTFLFQVFYIPSGSMDETLVVGDRVLVNKVVYDLRDPARGEVIVFHGPPNWVPENPGTANNGFFGNLSRTVGDLIGLSRPGEKDFIKRVIGLPGDTVACCDVNGRVTVNGYPLDEPYVTVNSPLDAPPQAHDCRSRRFDPVTVDPGQLFVMGDHRIVSLDSRCQGEVPIDDVIGKAWAIVWPSGRWDSLSVPATFKDVPPPSAAGPSSGTRPAWEPGPSGGRSAGTAADNRDTPVALGDPGVRTVTAGRIGALFAGPALAPLAISARTRRMRRWRRRTLPS